MKSIALIGCGNMGRALLTGWQKSAQQLGNPQFLTVDPFTVCEGTHHAKSIADLPATAAPELVILAVKPHQMADLLAECAAKFGTTPAYLSIAAGLPLTTYKKHLGKDARVIRAMPNTPTAIAKGVTALLANKAASEADIRHAKELFGCVGEVVILDDEAQMHAVTALSGSGPAYVFAFMEAMVSAAMRLGLSEQQALPLAMATVNGASAYAMQSDESLATLRQNVTSPNGTTQAGLNVLMAGAEVQGNGAIEQLMRQVLNAAANRSQSMADEA